jgi:DNA-binding transcriptional ArsR family regulator
MDNPGIIPTLAALAQTTRLDVFKLLVHAEPHGIAAGKISRLLNVPHNTLSTHLGILSRSGLVQSQRRSRSIIYRANLDRLRAMTLFLVADCCGGNPEFCAPIIADLIPCCPADAASPYAASAGAA